MINSKGKVQKTLKGAYFRLFNQKLPEFTPENESRCGEETIFTCC